VHSWGNDFSWPSCIHKRTVKLSKLRKTLLALWVEHGPKLSHLFPVTSIAIFLPTTLPPTTQDRLGVTSDTAAVPHLHGIRQNSQDAVFASLCTLYEGTSALQAWLSLPVGRQSHALPTTKLKDIPTLPTRACIRDCSHEWVTLRWEVCPAWALCNHNPIWWEWGWKPESKRMWQRKCRVGERQVQLCRGLWKLEKARRDSPHQPQKELPAPLSHGDASLLALSDSKFVSF
jgi:hypothetical protein